MCSRYLSKFLLEFGGFSFKSQPSRLPHYVTFGNNRWCAWAHCQYAPVFLVPPKWMNLANVVRNVREMSNVHRFCWHPRAIKRLKNGFLILTFRFLYKCSHLMKYLLTKLRRFVRRVFCPWSVQRPRAWHLYVQTSRSFTNNVLFVAKSSLCFCEAFTDSC